MNAASWPLSRARARSRAFASFSAARSRSMAFATASSAAFLRAPSRRAPSRAMPGARGGRDRSCIRRCSSWVSYWSSPIRRMGFAADACSEQHDSTLRNDASNADFKPMSRLATRSRRALRRFGLATDCPTARRSSRVRTCRPTDRAAVRCRARPRLATCRDKPLTCRSSFAASDSAFSSARFGHARERRADQPFARTPDAVFAQQRGERLARRDAALDAQQRAHFFDQRPQHQHVPASPSPFRPSSMRASRPTSPVSMASFSLNTS